MIKHNIIQKPNILIFLMKVLKNIGSRDIRGNKKTYVIWWFVAFGTLNIPEGLEM